MRGNDPEVALTKKYRNDKLVAAVDCTLESFFSKPLRVSIAFEKKGKENRYKITRSECTAGINNLQAFQQVNKQPHLTTVQSKEKQKKNNPYFGTPPPTGEHL